MSGFVNESQVFVNQQVATREDALRFLSERAVELGFADSYDEVHDAFVMREGEGVTGLTNGFAIPHAKSAVVNKAGVVVVKLAKPIDWPTFDEQPVDILMALLIPEAEGGTTHIKLLQKIAVMLMKEAVRDQIRALDDPAELAAFVNAGLED